MFVNSSCKASPTTTTWSTTRNAWPPRTTAPNVPWYERSSSWTACHEPRSSPNVPRRQTDDSYWPSIHSSARTNGPTRSRSPSKPVSGTNAGSTKHSTRPKSHEPSCTTRWRCISSTCCLATDRISIWTSSTGSEPATNCRGSSRQKTSSRASIVIILCLKSI
jgi:hypothetical protein